MDEQIVAYPYFGILLSNVNESTIDACNNIDKYQNHIVEWKKPYKKESVL